MPPSMQYMAILTKLTVYNHVAFQIVGYHETWSTDMLQTCEVSILQRERGLWKSCKSLEGILWLINFMDCIG